VHYSALINKASCWGHVISSKGIEVDDAKIDIILKLSPPMTARGMRSFLWHAKFYRRFVKDFSKFARPQKFAHLLFELMCDASDFGLEAVLGQRVDKAAHAIYYASMILYDAQLNYLTTEKRAFSNNL
jgi:hypothetical protein